jgi:hypothetical protein
MLAAFFGFVRDIAWELVMIQLNPFLGLVAAAFGGLGIWVAFQLLRR